MEKKELKTIIAKHLLGYLTKKPILELNENVSDFYDNDPNGPELLSEAMDEVWEELVSKYDITSLR